MTSKKLLKTEDCFYLATVKTSFSYCKEFIEKLLLLTLVIEHQKWLILVVLSNQIHQYNDVDHRDLSGYNWYICLLKLEYNDLTSLGYDSFTIER